MDLDQQAVLSAALERAEALASSDEEALRRLHAPTLRWTTHTGEVLDREGYIAGNVGGFLTWRSQNLEDVHIEVYGDSGVLTGVVVDDVERDGRSSIFRLRLTQVWARDRDGTWRCVAGHAGPTLDDDVHRGVPERWLGGASSAGRDPRELGLRSRLPERAPSRRDTRVGHVLSVG